jgi:hypothetical protein
MFSKLIRFIILTLLLLGTVYTTVAQASGGGGEAGGNAQTPVQVIVQLVATAAVLRILNQFNLP